MKGRFSKTFESWDQRNTRYYKEAFEKLEKENKSTFNFVAAFFSIQWLIFRKMYGWAILFILVNVGIQIPIKMLNLSPSMLYGVSILFSLILFVGFGFFGNTLYYKHVRSQVSKGYAKIPGYNPIDPIWSFIVFGVVVPCLFGVISGVLVVVKKGAVPTNSLTLLSILLQVFLLSIPRAMDQKKFRSLESAKPIKVTEKSVDQFLKKSDPKYVSTAACVWILSTILSVSVTAYLMLQVRGVGSKTTEISEKIDKLSETTQSLSDFSKSNYNTRPTIDDEGF